MIDETGKSPAGYVADRDLYLDKDGALVEADNAARVTLLARAGQTVPQGKADELGLGIGTKAEDEPAEKKAVSKPAETKAAEKPPAVKK